MPTISEIVQYSTLMYPRVADISTENQIIILNQLMDEINNKLLRVRWENDPYEISSIANYANYGLPEDCDPSNIIQILVSEDISTNLSVSTIWNEYKYVGLIDNVNMDSGYYYMLQDDDLYIFKDGLPLQTTNLVIRLSYYRTPTYILAIGDTPEVDSRYHNLFKYGLIQNVACIGDNPEPAIADYWQNKFDEELQVALRNLTAKFDNAPLKTHIIDEVW